MTHQNKWRENMENYKWFYVHWNLIRMVAIRSMIHAEILHQREI